MVTCNEFKDTQDKDDRKEVVQYLETVGSDPVHFGIRI